MPIGTTIEGLVGRSAGRPVFLGFAPARLLHRFSFADVLDEDTGRGYQRKFSAQHSLDFRRYIQLPNSATIPLTFNLRPEKEVVCWVERLATGEAKLNFAPDAGKPLAQVDCQHRLGFLNDLDIELPFMCFLGMTEREEMEVFSVINSKAKGLSTSLLDFHDASLARDLAAERPELFIALHLNNNSDSPWYRQLDLGGSSTSGMMRRASLRTMQKAVKRFIAQTKALRRYAPEEVAKIVMDFWSAIAIVLREPWENPRRYLLTKGVGVYALMAVAADLYLESMGQIPDRRFFITKLSEFITELDWTSQGQLAGLGGEGGVKAALAIIRAHRSKRQLKVV